MAFFDPEGTGSVACRAYLVTAEQFADVAAQEMRLEPGGEFAQALAAVLPERRRAAQDGSRPLRDSGPRSDTRTAFRC